jgi:hypothetical protein
MKIGMGSGNRQEAENLVELWDDNPSSLDLLGFSALIAPILSALASKDLDPVTIGIHGPWGSGKSTLLCLLADKLVVDDRYVVVSTNPWEYEDHDDVKGNIIGAVLDAIEKRASKNSSLAERISKRVADLAKRVSWARIGIALAKGTITMGWNTGDLLEAFALKPEEPRSLIGFRSEFAQLAADMEGVERVVVIVDDLDRCLPTAVVHTLEAIKLFLSVPRMVFVLAADKELVTDAIASYLPSSNRNERIARYYLEKIIQIPISLPSLPAHDSEAYIGLLLSYRKTELSGLEALIAHCDQRRAAGTSPLLYGFDESLIFRPDEATLRITAQISQGLGTERLGNPRMIKRFLNAFGIRRRIAENRGITIDPQVLIKLMILEDRYPDAFNYLLSIDGTDRQNILTAWEDWATTGQGAAPASALATTKAWAASEPPIANEELGPYLTLAASLTSREIRVTMSEELTVLLHRMVGMSSADRERAYEEAAHLSVDDRRRIAHGLHDQLRRAEDITRYVDALVELAKSTPELAGEITEWIESTDHSLFTAAMGVTIARSEVPTLVALARQLIDDERTPSETRIAIREGLG